MMRFVFSYKDVSAWLHNFFDLDMNIYAYNTEGGEFDIISPVVGIRKLVPPGLLNYKQYFHIDEFDTTSITIYLLGINGHDEMMNSLIVRFFNYCLEAEVLEPLPRGKVKIHLDKINLTRDILLQSFLLSNEGLALEFANNSRLFDQLRMVQMFLRAGYTQVRIIPEDMGYTGYWFSDDTLDYTLAMANHPADIRLCASFHVMEWIGWEEQKNKTAFHPIHPTTQIDCQYGEVKVSIPLTIAEPEINATTIQRNCKRIQSEVSQAIADIIDKLNINL